eukprot:31209-Pelagococcus_subviridis.AAC.15
MYDYACIASFVRGSLFSFASAVVVSVDALTLSRRSASALRTPGESVAVRTVEHLRPPLVSALLTLPQRLVVRPFRHRRRRLVLIDVLARQLLPELA